MWWLFRLHKGDATTCFSGFLKFRPGVSDFCLWNYSTFFSFWVELFISGTNGTRKVSFTFGVWWKYNQVFMQTFETKSPSCHCDFKYHFGGEDREEVGPYKSTIQMTSTFIFESDFPPVCQGYRWEPPTFKYSKQTYCPCVNHNGCCIPCRIITPPFKEHDIWSAITKLKIFNADKIVSRLPTVQYDSPYLIILLLFFVCVSCILPPPFPNLQNYFGVFQTREFQR